MNTLTFLNSPLLWGTLLASIPILIHLFYRRQYRRIDWAPMRYLKLTVQRNRRRVRLEQLILLLLRTLAVVLLFLLVARPVMHAEGLSRLLGTSGRVSRIVVLDDSLSMGYTEQGQSALGRGQEVLASLLSTFSPKDRLTLVVASAPDAPLLREVELEDVDELAAIARRVRPTEVFAAWEGVLKGVGDLIAGGSYPLVEVTLITDLRRAGWEAAPAELASNWAARRVRLRVFDVGLPATSNVALAALDQVDRLALVGAPTRFLAEVRNDTDQELSGLEANFTVDGHASLVRLPVVARGETVRLPLTATFQEPGMHRVAFELPSDALAGDNSRFCAVEAQHSIDVLLVDGEPATEPLAGETDFLALALSIPTEGVETFRIETLTDSEWSSSRPTEPDLLVLANVAQIGRPQAQALARLVDAGMGLMIFLGDAVDPDRFNQSLYQTGAGLSPVELVTSVEGEFSGVLIESVEGSPLESLAQLNPAALERIKVRKTYEVRLNAGADGVHVLARWNNQESAPAVVQRTFGRGQVLVWTTTADRAWTDWPTESSYVLAMRESARAIARATASLRGFVAGQPLRVALAATHDITLPAIELPGESEPKPLVVDTSEAGGKELAHADTRRAGFYQFAWHDSASGGRQEAFALNPDPRESGLARISIEEFKRLWEPLEVDVIALADTSNASLAVGGEEIWRTLAMGLLGLLIFESCFARWTGRQR